VWFRYHEIITRSISSGFDTFLILSMSFLPSPRGVSCFDRDPFTMQNGGHATFLIAKPPFHNCLSPPPSPRAPAVPPSLESYRPPELRYVFTVSPDCLAPTFPTYPPADSSCMKSFPLFILRSLQDRGTTHSSFFSATSVLYVGNWIRLLFTP